MELKFKQLPFTPEQGQVIYIESEYNKKLNKFIRNNYESLKSDFAVCILLQATKVTNDGVL